MTEMEYEQRLNEEAAEEAFIAERIEAYTQPGGCCDPFNPETFISRLGDAREVDTYDVLHDRLAPLLKADKLDYWAIGKAVVEYVCLASEELAERFAKDDLRQAREEAKYHDC